MSSGCGTIKEALAVAFSNHGSEMPEVTTDDYE